MDNSQTRCNLSTSVYLDRWKIWGKNFTRENMCQRWRKTFQRVAYKDEQKRSTSIQNEKFTKNSTVNGLEAAEKTGMQNFTKLLGTPTLTKKRLIMNSKVINRCNDPHIACKSRIAVSDKDINREKTNDTTPNVRFPVERQYIVTKAEGGIGETNVKTENSKISSLNTKLIEQPKTGETTYDETMDSYLQKTKTRSHVVEHSEDAEDETDAISKHICCQNDIDPDEFEIMIKNIKVKKKKSAGSVFMSFLQRFACGLKHGMTEAEDDLEFEDEGWVIVDIAN